MYSKDELQRGLNTHTFGRELFVYDSIDSTNTCAKALASTHAEEGTVVITEYQTAGRGRLGRTWLAESGSSLLFSVIIRPTIDLNKIGLLPIFAAASVALAVEAASGISCECKWPNDVLMNGKKCCGILIESAFQHHVLDYAIIGIGLNVNQKSFSEELADKATSLNRECNKEFDRKEVFHRVMTSLESLYSEVVQGNFSTTLKEWKARSSMFGKLITLTQAGKEIRGRAFALAADGGLVLTTPHGQSVYYAGDVTIVKQN
jgi:BirA family biotin operon repressor/biotin-[acetyl-CoA-carboxylase] ligase